MTYIVRILDASNDTRKTVEANKGQILHECLINENGYHAPCGGKGTCKKCKVKIKEILPYDERESELLTKQEMKDGIHYACMLKVDRDITVELKTEKYRLAKDIFDEELELDPLVKRKKLHIDHKKSEGIKDNLDDIKKQLGFKKVSPHVIKKIANIVTERDENEQFQNVVAIYDQEELLDITTDVRDSLGIAIDIGTTTVVSYLYNLNTGAYVDVISDVNYQKNYGYDVISRIQHANKPKGLKELNYAIIQQLNQMINDLLCKNRLDSSQLDEIVVTGNTTMLHLLVGANPKNIGISPFTPVFTDTIYTSANDIGLTTKEFCKIIILPSIASYVGADIVSGMIYCNMEKSHLTELLIDIGTNGEIALLSKGKIICCATAAGPAFEGANISHGTGGVFGAINRVYNDDGILAYTTINDEPPVGICGSGIIDSISYLISNGYVDETGYLEGEDTIEVGNSKAVVIANRQDGSSIYITQKDIREVQLAKGAIRAGVDTIVSEAGIRIEDIDIVHVAGGFGSFMDKESAINIGLLPENFKDKIRIIGNSAGKGAIKILLNQNYLRGCEEIRSTARYEELSNSVKFTNYYMEAMSF